MQTVTVYRVECVECTQGPWYCDCQRTEVERMQHDEPLLGGHGPTPWAEGLDVEPHHRCAMTASHARNWLVSVRRLNRAIRDGHMRLVAMRCLVPEDQVGEWQVLVDSTQVRAQRELTRVPKRWMQ